MRLSIPALALSVLCASVALASAQPGSPPPPQPVPGSPPANPGYPPPNPGYPGPNPGYPPPNPGYPTGGFQPPPPPPPAQPAFVQGYEYNEGIMVGLGLGLSALDCSTCSDSEGALGFDFYLGGFMNPRLALMYDLSGWFDNEDQASAMVANHAFAVQYWVSPKLWIKGGAGVGQARVAFRDQSDSRTGLGIGGGVGYELSQSGNFVVDLSGRGNRLHIDDVDFTTVQFLVGVRWK